MADDANRSTDANSVTLSDEEAVRKIVRDSIFGLWSVVNNLTRLKPSRDDRYRVTVFGSARTQPGHFVYEEVKRMCAGFGALGCDIITGGGPGLMEAANQGASSGQPEGASENIGIRIHLPFEQHSNPFVEQAFEHGTFFTRLHQFVLMSDAYVVAPGGIGTLLETSMIWQLLQVRQVDAPLILVGPMWRGLVDWAREAMLRPGFELASAADFQIPICVDTGEEAVAIVADHHAKWAAKAKAASPELRPVT